MGFWNKENGLKRDGRATNFLIDGTIEDGLFKYGVSILKWWNYYPNGTSKSIQCGPGV